MIPPRRSRRTVWVDVEDLFVYFEKNSRPSGIQRLVFETLRVLTDRAALLPDAPRIAFVRHTGNDALLSEVSFQQLTDIVEGASGKVAEVKVPSRNPSGPSLRRWVIRHLERLPLAIAQVLIHAGVLQLNALHHARMLVAAIARPQPKLPVPSIPKAAHAPPGFSGSPGDVFLVLGAPWVHRDFASMLHALRDKHGIGTALLLYDLIPVRRPEWCASELVAEFSAWLEETLPLYQRLIAISHATARDVEAYAHEIGLRLPGPVQPVPIGTGFAKAVRQHGSHPLTGRGLPPSGSYVLFVSTLEARKNHILLFRVWRRLLADMPRVEVPTLVFAGRVGWLVADLMQQLENVDWLDGKIRLLRDPTDLELEALYQGCQFTVFPSLFEGWGLPVSESLERGRPCVASNRTSLPEAGGDLARYFDPDNLDDAYMTIRSVIEDSHGLQRWRARVAQEFRHVPWDRTADAILSVCSQMTWVPATVRQLENPP